MKQTQIAVIVGSIRKDSLNAKLADALVKLAPPEFAFRRVRIDDLPLYSQDDDVNPAAAVTRLRQDIKAADGLLFLTPEYNRSIPGVLKNAIDHASRPWGQSVWGGKPAGVLTYNLDFARRCMELGSLFTAVGADLSVLLRGVEQLAGEFKNAEAAE